MFVTFEGPEGAGKSTVIAAVAERLQREGRETLVTREPGAGEVGRRIRQILLDIHEPIDPRCELFLFLADRAQHVASIVGPALRAGKVVLCDRHADSTVVYQGHARGLDLEFLRKLNLFATGGLIPDLTILLDLPAEVGLARLSGRDRLDAEPVEFHRQVREGFLREAKREPSRWRIVDAAQPAELVAAEVLALILAALKA